MIAIVNALLAMIRSLFKSRSALHVEILVLRHQLKPGSLETPPAPHTNCETS
jgi:hypothetical protein